MKLAKAIAATTLLTGVGLAHGQFSAQQNIAIDCTNASNSKITIEYALALSKELEFLAGPAWSALPLSASFNSELFVPTQKEILSFVSENTTFSTGSVDGKPRGRLGITTLAFCDKKANLKVEYEIVGRFTFKLTLSLAPASKEGLVQTKPEQTAVLQSIYQIFNEQILYVFGVDQKWLSDYERAAINKDTRPLLSKTLCGQCNWENRSNLALRLATFIEKYPAPWTDISGPPKSLMSAVAVREISPKASSWDLPFIPIQNLSSVAPFVINSETISFKNFFKSTPEVKINPVSENKEKELVYRVIATDDEGSFVEFKFESSSSALILQAVSIGGQI